jgi:hypothetical protein
MIWTRKTLSKLPDFTSDVKKPTSSKDVPDFFILMNMSIHLYDKTRRAKLEEINVLLQEGFDFLFVKLVKRFAMSISR